MENIKHIPTVGVICELNPLHNGHVYLLSQARALVGDEGCVVCVMSGRSTQRGEIAIADPYLRGKTAILGGADLVVELPFPWSSGSAEVFAKAGVHILSQMGVEHLIFGSECGNLSLLSLVADLVGSAEFGNIYGDFCNQGMGTAVAYQKAIATLAQKQGVSLPQGFPASNDLLGVAYLVANRNVGMTPHTVKRLGQGYNESILRDVDFPSATSLRLLMSEASDDVLSLSAMIDGCMPDACKATLLEGVEGDVLPVQGQKLLPLCHAYFRLLTDFDNGTAELSGGLDRHLHKVALQATSADEFWDMAQTKQYTEARLKRGMLFALTGVKSCDLATTPDYATLLAANAMGCRFMSAFKKSAGLPIVTKPADAPLSRQRDLCEQIDALYTLCMPKPKSSGYLTRMSPYIQK